MQVILIALVLLVVIGGFRPLLSLFGLNYEEEPDEDHTIVAQDYSEIAIVALVVVFLVYSSKENKSKDYRYVGV